MRVRTVALAGAFAALLASAPVDTADAQQAVADSMNCAQATAYFAAHGMIYKATRSGSVLSVRVGVPLAREAELTCKGRASAKRSYFVKTTDNPRCAISKYCG